MTIAYKSLREAFWARSSALSNFKQSHLLFCAVMRLLRQSTPRNDNIQCVIARGVSGPRQAISSLVLRSDEIASAKVNRLAMTLLSLASCFILHRIHQMARHRVPRRYLLQLRDNPGADRHGKRAARVKAAARGLHGKIRRRLRKAELLPLQPRSHRWGRSRAGSAV